VIRQGDADRALFMQLDGHHHAVLQEGTAIADKILLQFKLLIAFQIHEHQCFTLLEKELEVLLFEPDALDGLGSPEPFIELGAVDEVLHLDLVEGATLAGLDGIGLHNCPQAAIVLKHVAGANFISVDFHESVPRRALSGPGFRPRLAASRPQKAQLFKSAPWPAGLIGRNQRLLNWFAASIACFCSSSVSPW
jgi:hypothetical protein